MYMRNYFFKELIFISENKKSIKDEYIIRAIEEKDEMVLKWKEETKKYIDNLSEKTVLRFIGISRNCYPNRTHEELVKLLFQDFSIGFFRIEDNNKIIDD